MKKIDLNNEFRLHLERVGLKESQMGPDQLRETKRAFYGGCGQMLMLCLDEVGSMESERMRLILCRI